MQKLSYPLLFLALVSTGSLSISRPANSFEFMPCEQCLCLYGEKVHGIAQHADCQDSFAEYKSIVVYNIYGGIDCSQTIAARIDWLKTCIENELDPSPWADCRI